MFDKFGNEFDAIKHAAPYVRMIPSELELTFYHANVIQTPAEDECPFDFYFDMSFRGDDDSMIRFLLDNKGIIAKALVGSIGKIDRYTIHPYSLDKLVDCLASINHLPSIAFRRSQRITNLIEK